MSLVQQMNDRRLQQRPHSEGEEDSRLDLQRYVQLLLKRKWLILSLMTIVVGAASVWTFTRIKVYRATSTVLVDRRAPQVLGKNVGEVVDTSRGGYWRSKEYMQTQIQVITSMRLSRRVAEQLHLARDKAFWLPNIARRSLTVGDATRALHGMVKADPVRNANVIEIKVSHPSPKVAARLANAVAQAYRDQALEYKFTSTSGAVKWLADQLDDLKKQLQNAELALYAFKKKNNIISVSLESKQTLINSRIQKINDALTDIQLKRMALNAKRTQLAKLRNVNPLKIPVGVLTTAPTIAALKDRFFKERQRYVGLQQRYLAKHPLVREQEAKLKAVQRALIREVKNALAEVQTNYREVRNNERQLAAALQKTKNEALSLNRREVDYLRLKRTQENTAKLYSLVQTRMKESGLSAQLRVSNIRLLDRATAPGSPVRPRVMLNLAIALVLGLALGVGFAFLIDTLDNTVKSQADVEENAGLIFLGLMPRIPGGDSRRSRRGRRPDPKPELDLVVHRDPKSLIAESTRAIRTNLLFAATDRTIKSIVVTSPGPREGKTTSAVSLAIVMAQAGGRVLIVDTDMRKPRLHKVFGLPGAEGLTSALLGDGKLDDLIKTTEAPGLYLLPCGHVPPNPAEICQGEKFKELLAELAERFDRVILDSPPTMAVTDGVILSTIADGTLIVARAGYTTTAGLKETARQIHDVGGRLLGCVLNDMDMKEGGYGYHRYRRYGYHRYGYSRYAYGQHAEDGTSDGQA